MRWLLNLFRKKPRTAGPRCFSCGGQVWILPDKQPSDSYRATCASCGTLLTSPCSLDRLCGKH